MKTRQLFASLAVVLLVACAGGEKQQGSGGGAGERNTLVMMMKASPTNLDVRVGNDNAAGMWMNTSQR